MPCNDRGPWDYYEDGYRAATSKREIIYTPEEREALAYDTVRERNDKLAKLLCYVCAKYLNPEAFNGEHGNEPKVWWEHHQMVDAERQRGIK